MSSVLQSRFNFMIGDKWRQKPATAKHIALPPPKNGSGDLIPCFNPVNCVVSQGFVVCSTQITAPTSWWAVWLQHSFPLHSMQAVRHDFKWSWQARCFGWLPMVQVDSSLLADIFCCRLKYQHRYRFEYWPVCQHDCATGQRLAVMSGWVIFGWQAARQVLQVAFLGAGRCCRPQGLLHHVPASWHRVS